MKSNLMTCPDIVAGDAHDNCDSDGREVCSNHNLTESVSTISSF